MKGSATIAQKQKEALLQLTFPDLGLYRDRRKDYVNAARENAKVATGLENTVYDLFGPEFIGSAAFALDPLSSFSFESGIISGWNREQVRRYDPGLSSRTFRDETVIREYRNYDDDLILDKRKQFHLVSEDKTLSDLTVLDPFYQEDSVLRDTTVKSRGPSSPFGTCQMSSYTTDGTGPSELIQYITEKSDLPDRPDYFNRYDTQNIRSYAGPIAKPNGDVLSPFGTQFDSAFDFMNSEVLALLPKCLTSKRLFKSFYNIWELKDIPQMVNGLVKLQHTLQGFGKQNARHPAKNIRLDQFFSDQYLNAQFGFMSVYQAASQLLSLPARAAKRLNYLVQKNGEAITGRTIENYSIDSPLGDIPSFIYDLPSWATLLSSSTSSRMNIQLRLAVSQTLKFPSSAVPEFRDTNYREILGLNPTVSDVYDVIPWTWLIDWFSGLGDYIHVMDAINRDKSPINYGFISFVGDEVLTHRGQIEVTDRSSLYHEGDLVEETLHKRLYYAEHSYTRHVHYREDLTYLDGVKSYGKNWQQGLSDFQYSILGALLSKFS